MLINDASITGSLIVNASASLQNISLGGNIIPDETNLRNLGSTDKYFKEIYVSTGSINFVDGGSVVAVLSAGTITAIQSNTSSANSRLTALESVSASLQSFTASISTTNTFTSSATARLNALETSSASVDTLNTTQSNRLGSLETISASNISRITALETTSASVDILNTTQNNRLSALETTSASVDTLNTTQNTRLTNLEIKTGSLATTGSNTFIGTQTITGSLFISANLVVQGTSSLENITASAVSIGTNIVNLNTANPAIRYAGLVIGDSGSIGSSGSFLYDSVQDEMIFVHRGANSTVTSSVLLMGPQTYDSIGNEIYPTNNIIQKGTGNEHLIDSCIFDNGTTTCIKNNLVGIGTISGTSITGTSMTVATDCSGVIVDVAGRHGLMKYYNYGTGLIGACSGTDGGISMWMGRFAGTITTPTGVYQDLKIFNSGIATFSCQICTPYISVGDGTQSNADDAPLTIKRGLNGFAGLDFKSLRTEGNIGGTRYYDCAGTLQSQLLVEVDGSYNFYNATSNNRLKITNSGISCFACQVCAPKFIATHLAATCLTLNGFSSGNGFKMDYGNASGQITAINLMANGTTNGFIGIQMVDGSNGDLWFGSSANRSMTVYRTTGHVGFGIDAPCTRVHAEGGYGSKWGGNGCFYGGGISGGGMPYGDIYGNGASYTYQACNTNANNSSLWGGFAAGYFKGGPGQDYGGGGAGIVAIGGNGGNAESVNAGGGAGIFARGGKNGAGSVHSYAAWFDGGDVMVRCGFLGVNNTAPRTFVHIVGASCGADIACGFGNADARGTLHVEACSGFQNSNITVENAYGIGQFMQWSTGGMRIGHRILKGGGTGDVHMTAGQDSVKLLIYATGNIGAPSGSNIYNASDCRLKKNIRNISYGICDVMKLQPKVFNWKDNFTPSENGKEMLGFIAQDVQPIVPEVVEQFSDGSDITFDCETITNPLRVNEKFIIPILTKAIQEQQCMIDTLKSCLGIS